MPETIKRIAYLTDGWKKYITYGWTIGIQNAIEEAAITVQIYQYHCWGNGSGDMDYNYGEYNIFRLPDLTSFDGIILDCTNIVDEDTKDRFLDLVRQSGVPAVSLCYAADGIIYVGVDGYSSISEIVDHLYQVHGFRRYIFAAGPKGNYENEERVRGFRDTLTKLGLSDQTENVYYGDFDWESGVELMHRLSDDQIPDVIVCANDNIAVGVIKEAEQRGFRVPEDLSVTGYDCFDKATFFKPQLTSAEVIRENCAMKAMQILIDLWAGNKPAPHNYIHSRVHFSESCGCVSTQATDYRNYAKEQILSTVHQQSLDRELQTYEYSLMQSEKLHDLTGHVLEKVRELGCDGCYILLDDRIYTPKPDTKLSSEGYDFDHLKLFDSWDADETLAAGTTAVMHRKMWEHPGSDLYFHLPLHFAKSAVGFIVIRNPQFLGDYFIVNKLHAILLNCLNTQYKSQQITYALKRMEEIYDRDRLTGAYARTAISDKVYPAFVQWLALENPVAVCFVDADNFKNLNDTYGHVYGDRVLIQIVTALNDCAPTDHYTCRYGGDEFLVLFPCSGQDEMEAYRQTVNDNLAKLGIGISMGLCLAPNPDMGYQLDSYINEADHKMYNEKAAHHKRRAGDI